MVLMNVAIMKEPPRKDHIVTYFTQQFISA
jgi:hypothetical protein